MALQYTTLDIVCNIGYWGFLGGWVPGARRGGRVRRPGGPVAEIGRMRLGLVGDGQKPRIATRFEGTTFWLTGITAVRLRVGKQPRDFSAKKRVAKSRFLHPITRLNRKVRILATGLPLTAVGANSSAIYHSVTNMVPSGEIQPHNRGSCTLHILIYRPLALRSFGGRNKMPGHGFVASCGSAIGRVAAVPVGSLWEQPA